MKSKLGTDFWRFAVSFLVVAIHISPFEQINAELDFFFTAVLGRVAVPLFLMITGYHLLGAALEDTKVLVNYTKKIFKQYLICTILYLPLNIYMGDFKNFGPTAVSDHLKSFFTDGTFYHLWYFPALILGIWLSFLLLKVSGSKKALIAAGFLYLIGLFGDSYWGFVEGNKVIAAFYQGIFDIFGYTRNGLFFTPIFLCLGHYVHTDKKSGRYDPICCLLLFLLMSGEGMALHYMGVQRHTSMYLFLVPLMFFSFRIIINTNGGQNKLLRSMAANIYILHPMVIVGVRFVSKLIGVREIVTENNLVLYVAVCLISVLLSLPIYFLPRKKRAVK